MKLLYFFRQSYEICVNLFPGLELMCIIRSYHTNGWTIQVHHKFACLASLKEKQVFWCDKKIMEVKALTHLRQRENQTILCLSFHLHHGAPYLVLKLGSKNQWNLCPAVRSVAILKWWRNFYLMIHSFYSSTKKKI